jgi:hypothetical protein
MRKTLAMAAFMVGLGGPAVAQEFRVSPEALQCVLNNRGLIEQVQGPLVFLDLSPCPGAPPNVGGNQLSTEQRAVSNKSTVDSDMNTILIFRRDRLDCYFNVASRAAGTGGGVVTLNFSECGQ